MISEFERERRTLDWWPEFAREMFAHIAAFLQGEPLDRARAYDIEGPWPGHRIEIDYVSREEFAAEQMDEPEGKFLVYIAGERYGGARWEFLPGTIGVLIEEAWRRRQAG
jgi:hypothetical protein